MTGKNLLNIRVICRGEIFEKKKKVTYSGTRVFDRVTMIEIPRAAKTQPNVTRDAEENRQQVFIDTATLCVGSTTRYSVTKVFVDPNRNKIIKINLQ